MFLARPKECLLNSWFPLPQSKRFDIGHVKDDFGQSFRVFRHRGILAVLFLGSFCFRVFCGHTSVSPSPCYTEGEEKSSRAGLSKQIVIYILHDEERAALSK